MITCTFNGRLGNNLFQMATTLSIVHKTNSDVIFPETTWAGHRGHVPVDLSIFGYEFNRGVIQTTNSYNETQFHYNAIDVADDLTIHGFYQSDKYFNSIREQLLNKYFVPSQTVLDRLSTYEIPPNSLGISVRRGDYLMLQENHCVLSTEYYQECINTHFQNNVDRIYIFSDDIEWCRSIFGDSVNYVQDTVGTQLFLMSKMKHLILSNSTFAWWAAWLSESKDKMVIAPNNWFKDPTLQSQTSDIIPSSWIKL